MLKHQQKARMRMRRNARNILRMTKKLQRRGALASSLGEMDLGDIAKGLAHGRRGRWAKRRWA